MEQHLKYARILVPVDGSQESLRAVRVAGEFAHAVHSTVYLLYVSPFDKSTDEGDVSWLPASIVRPAAEEAHEIFAAALACLPNEVPRERAHRAGTPADEILRFIDEMSIGLVVIGGRKRSRMSGFLLGSVTQAVLEHAHSSVMIAGCAE
ncbi:MAG: universal stress protein [Selenomonas massiliensis]